MHNDGLHAVSGALPSIAPPIDATIVPIEHVPAAVAADHAGALTEWRRNWGPVLAGLAGMSISGMTPYSLGLFMDPLTQSFG